MAFTFSLALLLGVALAACGERPSSTSSTPVPTAAGAPDQILTGPAATATPSIVGTPTDKPVAAPSSGARPPDTPVPTRPTTAPEPAAAATASPMPGADQSPVPIREAAPPEIGTVVLPIEVVNASDLGSLQFDIVYDARVLEFHSIETGSMAKEALLVSNLDVPGRLKIALVDASGISGDGVVLRSHFVLISQRGATELAAEVQEASDTELRELAVKTSPGAYKGNGNNPAPLRLHFLR